MKYCYVGWIKGVKGENFSYALGYNGTDYKAINAPTHGGQHVGLKETPIAINAQGQSMGLYNGNIATWASLNPKTNGTTTWTQQFTYDQLNRIKTGATQGGTHVDQFRSTYGYDANGNLKSLERWNKAGAKMDEFTYNYEDKKSGYLANTNKLRSVDDKPEFSTVSSEDLDDQGIDNYQYDDIGNLNRDEQESIVKIEWTVYGKVKAVNRLSDPITKLPLGNKPNLVFEYDASGNRTCKISIDKAGVFTKTYYLRDASGNVMSTYTTTGTSSLIALQEQYLYGSSRLGVLEKGKRSYELTDHLGNVRTVVNEAKSVSSATDYYPFGMMAEQYAPSGGYRYGFNGKEKDTEGMGGGGGTYDYGFRIYNPALGKFTSVDPLFKGYAWYTPYQFAGNKPIVAVDLDGLEEAPTNNKIKKSDPNQAAPSNGNTPTTPAQNVPEPVGTPSLEETQKELVSIIIYNSFDELTGDAMSEPYWDVEGTKWIKYDIAGNSACTSDNFNVAKAVPDILKTIGDKQIANLIIDAHGADNTKKQDEINMNACKQVQGTVNKCPGQSPAGDPFGIYSAVNQLAKSMAPATKDGVGNIILYTCEASVVCVDGQCYDQKVKENAPHQKVYAVGDNIFMKSFVDPSKMGTQSGEAYKLFTDPLIATDKNIGAGADARKGLPAKFKEASEKDTSPTRTNIGLNTDGTVTKTTVKK